MKKTYKVNELFRYGFGIVIVIMITIAAFSWRNTDQFEQAQVWNDHTMEVKLLIANVLQTTVDAETGQRGYIYTGKEPYLEPYLEARGSITGTLDRLAKRISDNPSQVERMAKVRSLAQKKFEELKTTVDLKRAGKDSEVFNIVLSDEGKLLMGELRTWLNEMEKVEDELLATRRKQLNALIERGTFISIGGTLLAILVSVLVAWFVAHSIMRPIRNAMVSVSSTSREIAVTISQHERTANQQAAMTNQTASTMEELGGSSRQTAEQAASAAELTKKASTLTREGADSVTEAVAAMEGLRENIEAVAAQILNLSEQTAQIGGIAGLVKDLAAQINMLALNAAVEAARAGEYGRGFGVVATEVRKLANESKKSAEQTGTVVANIRKATDATIMQIEEGKSSAANVTEITQRVGDLFALLSETSGEVYDNAQQVLMNLKQQASAISQVVDATNTMNTGASETAAGIAQTKAGIQNLDETTQALREMV